jgi:hypothetical protein
LKLDKERLEKAILAFTKVYYGHKIPKKGRNIQFEPAMSAALRTYLKEPSKPKPKVTPTSGYDHSNDFVTPDEGYWDRKLNNPCQS